MTPGEPQGDAGGLVADRMLIGGRWREAVGGGTWDLIDPGSGRSLGPITFGDERDAVAAVEAAAGAHRDWSRASAYDRADVLGAAATWIDGRIDALARLTTQESGKPLSEAAAEWRSCTNYLRWFAGEGVRAYGRIVPPRTTSRRIHVQHASIGVVATITAWNFPIYNVVRSWAAALAAGCTVVGRPSEFTPRSAMLLAQALHEGGAPPGVVNVVNGDPEAMAEVFLADPRVRKIAFTGSPRVGKLLMDGASRTLTRLALELGGNAPVLVFPDVDVEEVARAAVRWKYRNAGQVCVAPQRVMVHEDVRSDFIEVAVDAVSRLRVGHGLDEGTEVGPLVNARQRERVDELVRGSAERGARVLLGGAALDRPGFFYAPTVLDRVGPDMPAVRQELFGPVMPIASFEHEDEAVAAANATEYGLAAFVMTHDLGTATRVSEALEFGMVCVNDWLPATPEAPFGGMKGSGIGRETGSEGLHEYLEVKTVFVGGIDRPRP